MKKLKIALCALFALTMSLFLFACGPKKDPEKTPTEAKVDEVIVEGSISVGDSVANADAIPSDQLSAIKVKVVYEGVEGTTELTSADYTIDYTAVTWQKAGSYKATVKPTAKNEYNLTGELTVNITHTFVEGTDGQLRCQCGAVQLKYTDLKESVKIGGWHGGVTLGADNKMITAPGGALTGVTPPPTSTVGQLDKGTKITLTGTAHAHNAGNTYYTPILGIANLQLGSDGGAVLQRNDNYTIYDGMTNGLHGFKTELDKTSNIDATLGEATATSEELKTYYQGDISESKDYYDEAEPDKVTKISLSWEYREDGVAVMTWDNLDTGRVRTVTVKMPERSFYNAILHGEEIDMEFDTMEVVQSLQLKEISSVTGTPRHYIENEMFDSSELTVNIAYEGKEGTSKADLVTVWANETANATDETAGWVDLGFTPLTAKMQSFRVSVTVGVDTKYKSIPAITVVKNAVNDMSGHDVEVGGVNFPDSGLTDFAFGATSNDLAEVTVKGVAKSLTDAQRTALGVDSSFTHYVTFYLYGREGTVGAFATTGTYDVVIGTAAAGKAVATEAGVGVVVAVKADTTTATIKGANADGKDIVVVFDGLRGVGVVSTVTVENLSLNSTGDFTIVYKNVDVADAQALVDDYSLVINGRSVFFNTASSLTPIGQNGTVQVKSATLSGKDLTVTYTYGGFDPVEPRPIAVQLVDLSGEPVVSDTIYPATEFAAGDNVKEGNVFVSVSGTNLYLAQAINVADVKDANVAGQLSFQANVGDDTPAALKTYDVLKTHDFSFKTTDGVTAFATTPLTGLATIKTVVFGTINNAKDTDHGAVVVVTVDLTKLGVRTESATQKFFFAVNANATEFKYASVNEQNVVSADSAAVNATENRTALVEATHFIGEVQTTKLEGDKFYANVSLGDTLAHTWVAVQGKTGVYQCSVCKAIRNYTDEDTDVVASNVLIDNLPDNLVETGLTVGFEIGALKGGDWATRFLVTGKGDLRVTAPNLDAHWHSVLQDVEGLSERETALATKFVWGGSVFPTADDIVAPATDYSYFLKGYKYVTISMSVEGGVQFYANGELVYNYAPTRALGGGPVSEFVELFLSIAQKTGIRIMDSTDLSENAPEGSEKGAEGEAWNVYVAPTSNVTVSALYNAYAEVHGAPTVPEVPFAPDPDRTNVASQIYAWNDADPTHTAYSLTVDDGKSIELEAVFAGGRQFYQGILPAVTVNGAFYRLRPDAAAFGNDAAQVGTATWDATLNSMYTEEGGYVVDSTKLNNDAYTAIPATQLVSFVINCSLKDSVLTVTCSVYQMSNDGTRGELVSESKYTLTSKTDVSSLTVQFGVDGVELKAAYPD